MSAEDDLLSIAQTMKDLEGRFVDSRQLGLYLSTEDEAEFKRLTVEAMAILDGELGPLNGFSMNLSYSINQSSGGFLPGPSLASVQGARALVEGAVNQIRRGPALGQKSAVSTKPSYVDSSRLASLRALPKTRWDGSRLVRLCEELNIAYNNDCYMATAMLVRAIADHVPPIFGCKSFNEVANNVSGAKSFRGSMQHLNQSLRNVADAHLHVQIRASETLPTGRQVNFSADLDVLLAEIIRLLK